MIGSRPVIMKSVVESGDSGLESADSSIDSNADLAKCGLWVMAVNLQGGGSGYPYRDL